MKPESPGSFELFNTGREPTCPMLNLERDSSKPGFYVPMESFFDFSFWIAEELQELISEYQWRQQRAVERTSTKLPN